MKELRLDQYDVADRLEIAQPTVSAKLNGKRKLTADEAIAWAKALEMSICELLLGHCHMLSGKDEQPSTGYIFASQGSRAVADWALSDPRKNRKLPVWATELSRKQLSAMIEAAECAQLPSPSAGKDSEKNLNYC